jgi:hypothetical protein
MKEGDTYHDSLAQLVRRGHAALEGAVLLAKYLGMEFAQGAQLGRCAYVLPRGEAYAPSGARAPRVAPTSLPLPLRAVHAQSCMAV